MLLVVWMIRDFLVVGSCFDSLTIGVTDLDWFVFLLLCCYCIDVIVCFTLLVLVLDNCVDFYVSYLLLLDVLLHWCLG